jgi:hypothetical protein
MTYLRHRSHGRSPGTGGEGSRQALRGELGLPRRCPVDNATVMVGTHHLAMSTARTVPLMIRARCETLPHSDFEFRPNSPSICRPGFEASMIPVQVAAVGKTAELGLHEAKGL